MVYSQSMRLLNNVPMVCFWPIAAYHQHLSAEQFAPELPIRASLTTRPQMNTSHDLFHSAFHAKDIDAALKALANLDDQATAPLLAKLLLEHWHEAHEDIVFELGLIGEPSTTAAIAKAAEMRFEYLIDWDNLHAFQRKCAYALARIGTTESKVALELMAKHSDPMLREYGQEGLEHWPIPYKGNRSR